MQNETDTLDIEEIIKNAVRNNGMIVSWRNFSGPVGLYLTEDFRKYAIESEIFPYGTLHPHTFKFINHWEEVVKTKIYEGYKVFKYYMYKDHVVRGAFMKELEVSEEFIDDIQQFYFWFDSEELKKRI